MAILLSDLDLFVFVRNATEGAGLHDHVGGAEVDSRGKFTLNLSDGEYSAGAFVPQESGYRHSLRFPLLCLVGR